MNKAPNTPKISKKEDGLGMGYYILIIISLIFITYSITLVSMYASDTIDFNPDKSNWMWLSIGMIGLLGCFGMYFVLKPKSSKQDVESLTKPGQTPQKRPETQYGAMPGRNKKGISQGYTSSPISGRPTARSEYGFIRLPNTGQYDIVPPLSGQYDIAPPLLGQYGILESDNKIEGDRLVGSLKHLPNLK
jgi:hypothetical protein